LATTPIRGARDVASSVAPPALVALGCLLIAANLRPAITTVGPLIDDIRADTGMSSAAAGLLTALPLLMFAAISPLAPRWARRIGIERTLLAAMFVLAAGLVVRSAGPVGAILAGTLVLGGAIAVGNVLLPGLVKRYFPHRTGLLVGAYGMAMAAGGAVASISAAPIAAALGPEGWRWALGWWAVPALLAALPWLAVPARPGASRGAHRAVRMRSLVHSPTAVLLSVFFGLQAMQAYVIIGWAPQYLRDEGLSAAAAGLLLGVNTIVVIPLNAVVPVLTVRPHLQRPLLAGFGICYVAGWVGLLVAPVTVPWLWMTLLALGLGTFAMVLTLIGMRARTPETTSALATVTQGWGYLLSGAGPLLVGVLRGTTGGYTGMFVVVLAGVAGLMVTGWFVTRPRFVDDEVPGWSGPEDRTGVIEVAGTEPPVAVPLRTPGAGSPRG
jgi:MFS transporter, CP family, cyanate transporter